jgi:hypothetical protein
MSAGSVAQAGRRAAEAQLCDTFTAYSPNGRGPDPSNPGYEIDMYTTVATGVRGKTQAGSQAGQDASPRTVTVGDVERVVMSKGLHIPVSAAVPTAGQYHVGWEYLCTAIGPDSDPANLGKRYLVVAAPSKTYDTARRLDVVVIP